MCCASRVNCSGLRSSVAALVLVGAVTLVMAAENGSPGPLAQTCGVPAGAPAGGGRGGLPVFPPGQYPVKLPAVSMLGARNDLPNPYQPGVSFGQLPQGR